MNVLGFDVGGANIKCADPDGQTVSTAFPMWQSKDELESELKRIAAAFSEPDLIGLTMTAELADCFVTKDEGVRFVIAAVQRAFPEIPIRCWLTSGEFAGIDDALQLTEFVAAANWHALATWFGKAVPNGPAVLIDMGSTTTDIIPLLDGIPVPAGRTDLQRLQSSELLYFGAGRTPLCSLLNEVWVAGQSCPVAAEFFSTIADALVLADVFAEQPEATDTADGRPLTAEFCANRIAHQICCDASEVSADDIRNIAIEAVERQRALLMAGLTRVMESLEEQLRQNDRQPSEEQMSLLLSGSGIPVIRRHLAESKLKRSWQRVMSLEEMAGKSVAGAACAFAVARLAHDLCRDDLLKTYQPLSSGEISPD